MYYGTYKGDLDDGSNRFKRWFWNHKITRSLHDNAEGALGRGLHAGDVWRNGSAGVTGGKTPQSAYERLAATGAEWVKVDFWDGTGKGWYTLRDWTFRPEVWPEGFDYAAKAHKAGLKASLYMGGTYMDCDLTTKEGATRNWRRCNPDMRRAGSICGGRTSTPRRKSRCRRRMRA